MKQKDLDALDPYNYARTEKNSIFIRVEPEVKKMLVKAADADNVSLTKLVNHIVIEWLKKNGV